MYFTERKIEMKKYLAIDIGGTNIKYAEIEETGNIVRKDKIKTPKDRESFLSAVDRIVTRHRKNVSGIAVCAPGKIDGTTIRFGGALPFLDGVDLASEYAGPDFPVAVINDGKAGVLAEHWLGNLKGSRDCAAVILGTGVGGGIIVNGNLVAGSHFQAGELSFMDLDENAGGMDGTAGQSLSAVGMIVRINRAVGNADEKDGLAAFEAVTDGNEKACAILEKYCHGVAVLILNVQSVVDLEKYVIGGGISAQPALIEGINRAYDGIIAENEAVASTLTRPEIVTAAFRNDANLYGALYNLLEGVK